MKNLAIILSFTSLSLHAQFKNTCSAVKTKGNTHKVASMLASGYIVNLENQYNLHFYHLNLPIT